MPDIVFVSLEDWDEIWRRNQFFVAELARRYPESKILFVGQPENVTYGVKTGDLSPLRRALSKPKLLSPEGLPNVFLLKPPKWLPNTLTLGRKLNEKWERRSILRACRALGIAKPLLWLNPHFAVHMVGRMGESRTIYDITDDWTLTSQSERERRLVIAQDAELCAKADSVLVCSESLYKAKSELACDLHLIFNGVDASHYASVLDSEDALPEIARNWQTPVYGYTGTIHPERVDVDLVEAIARKMTGGTLALVGPLMLSEQDQRRLNATGRVVMTGGVPYRNLPDIMRAFAVCMTPHLVTPFTESLNPIKLWEYLAAGKPIVSTPVAGFRDFPQFVRCATGGGRFSRRVDRSANGSSRNSVATSAGSPAAFVGKPDG